MVKYNVVVVPPVVRVVFVAAVLTIWYWLLPAPIISLRQPKMNGRFLYSPEICTRVSPVVVNPVAVVATIVA